MAKGKKVLAKLAKTKPTKAVAGKAKAPPASLMQMMQGAPSGLGQAFGS